MNLLFKPKKQQIHVPGYGVVQKEDFNEEHFRILMKRAGEKKDEFIKQYFEVVSYGDQPLFQEAEQKPSVKKSKKELAAEAKEKEEAELLAQMEAEEAAKKQKDSTDKENE